MIKNSDGSPENLETILKTARNNILLFEKVAERKFLEFFKQVKNSTMCSMPALYDLYLSIKYINQARIPGEVVEIGCWKGGSMAMALLSDTSRTRHVVGFDTFEGHFEPPSEEIDIRGHNMQKRWRELNEVGIPWNKAEYGECQEFLESIVEGQTSRFELVRGDINQTAFEFTPREISLLRIDCDWYKESLTSLQVFWPMLSRGGVLILDDYGHHPGQMQAVTEFFADNPIKITHVDYSCVSIIKPF